MLRLFEGMLTLNAERMSTGSQISEKKLVLGDYMDPKRFLKVFSQA